MRQFLYDQFSPQYRETAAEDMYRGEFEIHGQVVGFDIQDVSGGYVYEFPGECTRRTRAIFKLHKVRRGGDKTGVCRRDGTRGEKAH